MHLPLHTSSKREGLFDCFPVEIKKTFRFFFAEFQSKYEKCSSILTFCINFVLFSLGKAKFSMASCSTIIFNVSSFHSVKEIGRFSAEPSTHLRKTD